MRPPFSPRPNATSSSSSVAEEGIGPQAIYVNPLRFFSSLRISSFLQDLGTSKMAKSLIQATTA